jgi:molybdopterin converting factor subunit 1
MRIHIHLFAQLAEAVDARQLEIDLPDGATVDDALTALSEQHDAIAQMRATLAAAIDDRYVGGSTALADGMQIALIPPVSGG